MPCGAILYFDVETDAAIRGQWQIIEDAGLPSTLPGLDYPPHLTLVACEDMDMGRLRAQMPAFVAEHPPLPVQFSGLGIFNAVEPVVYLAVAPSQALLNFHASFLEMVRPYLLGDNTYYQPGTWVPHITLAQGVPREMTGAVVDALLRRPLPQRGLLKEVVLADFIPQRPGLNEIFKARLGRYL
jgi:hypothetical protein